MQAGDRPIRLGYACISIPMRERDIFCSRTVRLATVVGPAGVDVERLMQLARANVADLERILHYNEEWGCRFFRITSNLFPHMGNPLLWKGAGGNTGLKADAGANVRAEHLIDAGLLADLARIGSWARGRGMRLTMHPGQFAQLAAPDPAVFDQTVIDLRLHAETLMALGVTPERDGACMVIHGGGVWGDKDAALARWASGYARLDTAISQYIVLENDEFNYSVWDLLPLCERLRIPFVLDWFHHSVWCRRNGEDFNAIWGVMDRIVGTWRARGIRPKCHYSEQRPDSRDGAHSDSIEAIPAEILRVCVTYGIDIMLEVKDKDICMKAVLERQFVKNVGADGRVTWSP